MTTDTSTAYRDPTASQVEALRREVERLTAELAKRDAVRPRWTLIDVPKHDEFVLIVAGVTLAVIASWLFLAGCFAAFGAAPFVLRWAAVNVVATALWCLAFVRREVKP